jgi:hypothetical protein
MVKIRPWGLYPGPSRPVARRLGRGAYFGRNKVNYEKFDFRILSTKHYDIHFYTHDQELSNDVGRMAERWYQRQFPRSSIGNSRTRSRSSSTLITPTSSRPTRSAGL